MKLTFDVCNSSNVILCREHKLIIDDPLRFVVQAGWGMKLYHLVIFNGQVVTCPLQVGHL